MRAPRKGPAHRRRRRRSREGWHNFKNRPPDVILEMPAAFEVPAEGSLPVFTVWSPNPFTEDQFIEAVELRPGAVGAVHHSDVTARALPGRHAPRTRPGVEGRSARGLRAGLSRRAFVQRARRRSAARRSPRTSARRAALRTRRFGPATTTVCCSTCQAADSRSFRPARSSAISAGNVIAWNLHYTPTGKPEKDRHRLGLWLATHAADARSGDQAHRRSAHRRGREFVGRPRRASSRPSRLAWTTGGSPRFTPFQEDVTLYGLWPHMHLRGKDMTFIATFPDGREEVLLHVPKYDFYWQLQYQLASRSTCRPGARSRRSATTTTRPATSGTRDRSAGLLVGAELGRDVQRLDGAVGRPAGDHAAGGLLAGDARRTAA